MGKGLKMRPLALKLRYQLVLVRGHSNSTFARRGGEGVSKKANKNQYYLWGRGGVTHPKERSLFVLFLESRLFKSFSIRSYPRMILHTGIMIWMKEKVTREFYPRKKKQEKHCIREIVTR